MSQDKPTISLNKKFVSQDEIEEQKRKRQEEWEKVRKPDQPIEAPEEKYDPRSLFDRLQEQKQKKEDEYESQFALKNQVKGLEDGEVDFLDFVSDRQVEIEKQRKQEMDSVLAECRNVVTVKESGDKITRPAKSGASSSKKSQSQLLAGALKRKSSDTGETEEKRCKVADPDSGAVATGAPPPDVERPAITPHTDPLPTIQVAGVLPGLGLYSDSDLSSDSSTSEDELMPRRTVVSVEQRGCTNQS